MSFAGLLLLVFIGYGLYRIFAGSAGPRRYCMTCGHDGPTTTITRGSFGIEIILWLCFIIPGVIYSLWRLTTRAPACSSCGASTLVPVDSPAATAMRKQLGGS